MMTTTIKLDTGAMNALFPEGSEVRVSLQNAVIVNFASKNLDKFLDAEMRKQIELIVKNTISESSKSAFESGINDAIEEYFSTKWKNLSLLNSGKDKIRREAKAHATQILTSASHDVLHKQAEELHNSLIARVEEIAPAYLQDFKDKQLDNLIKNKALELISKAAEDA